MGIELRKQRNGELRPTWYGRYEANGKRYTVNLGIKIRGMPPESLRELGDLVFEKSRSRAKAKLDSIIEEARRPGSSAHLVERIYEMKTGEQIRSIPLHDLPEEWTRIPRRRKPSDQYVSQCRATLVRFTEFVAAANPDAERLLHVNHQLARSFMDAEASRGVTAKTWNDTLALLRAAFRHLFPAGAINPFSGIPTRETRTVFRKPFTPDELKAIVDAAQGDDFIRPILITGICTAMRRGDCCLLRRQDVDLERRFITVKTSKTGQIVSIPVFPMLYDELRQWPGEDRFVFPEQAAMYRTNAGGITRRVRKVFAAAGFRDPTEKKKEEEIRGRIHADREEGLRRASVRDFHSFRVTWVTLALTAGVPLELVQKVTGHKTTDIVLKHYFQPGREQFRQALQAAMPQLLTAGASCTPLERIAGILAESTRETAWRDVKAVRELIDKAARDLL